MLEKKRKNNYDSGRYKLQGKVHHFFHSTNIFLFFFQKFFRGKLYTFKTLIKPTHRFCTVRKNVFCFKNSLNKIITHKYRLKRSKKYDVDSSDKKTTKKPFFVLSQPDKNVLVMLKIK